MDQPILHEDDRPLFFAARTGDLQQVEALIERGIAVVETDEVCVTLLALLLDTSPDVVSTYAWLF
jgi:hypothetical protein